ncbi:hypothetical protein RAS1_05300 [Phycisphaerae bacterium RAS1]|nr:hypothetical protein RAS1_05300 [Phycisphaerae bacterium RAS1]
MFSRLYVLWCASLFLTACDRSPPAPSQKPPGGSSAAASAPAPPRPLPGAHEHDPGEAAEHIHLAPHRGMLIVLSDHQAHLELVLDEQAGRMTFYVLDGECEKPIRLSQESMEVELRVIYSKQEPAPTEFSLTLQARDNPLTGETTGDSSEFTAESEKLVGLKRFTGRIARIVALGVEHAGLLIEFPEGGE